MKKKRLWQPVLLLLFLAPFCGEVLSTSSPPLEIIQPLTLALQVMLYGCGALLIREVARRNNLGWASIFLLGMAYGIYEEGIVVRSFFDPAWGDLGMLGVYGRASGVNWIWALGLTLFHAVISIISPIILTELIFPSYSKEPWLKRCGLIVPSLFLFAMVPIGLLFQMHASATHLLLSWAAIAVLCLIALKTKMKTDGGKALPPFLLGFLSFCGMVSLLLILYFLPALGLPPLADGLLALLLFLYTTLLLRKVRDRRSAFSFASGSLLLWIIFTFLTRFDPGRTDNLRGILLVGAIALGALILIRRKVIKSEIAAPENNDG